MKNWENRNLGIWNFASMESRIFAKLVAVVLKGLLPTWYYLSGGFLKVDRHTVFHGQKYDKTLAPGWDGSWLKFIWDICYISCWSPNYSIKSSCYSQFDSWNFNHINDVSLTSMIYNCPNFVTPQTWKISSWCWKCMIFLSDLQGV